MPNVSLKAHYDGERVAWVAASGAALARSFANDEPEYSPADIRR